MKALEKLILAACAAGIMVACSERKPDETSARAVFENYMKSRLEGVQTRRENETKRYQNWLISLDKARLSDSLVQEAELAASAKNNASLPIQAIPFTIKLFKKTNGQTGSVSGVETYTVEYTAILEYPEGIVPECIGKEHSTGSTGLNCPNILGVATPKPKGDRETINGRTRFEMTDKGWRGEDGIIY